MTDDERMLIETPASVARLSFFEIPVDGGAAISIACVHA
jgi:hypothetical protein